MSQEDRHQFPHHGLSISQEALEVLARQDPVDTISSATTAVRGVSRCRFCGAAGRFRYSGGREWVHLSDCPWEAAVRALNSPRSGQ